MGGEATYVWIYKTVTGKASASIMVDKAWMYVTSKHIEVNKVATVESTQIEENIYMQQILLYTHAATEKFKEACMCLVPQFLITNILTAV